MAFFAAPTRNRRGATLQLAGSLFGDVGDQFAADEGEQIRHVPLSGPLVTLKARSRSSFGSLMPLIAPTPLSIFRYLTLPSVRVRAQLRLALQRVDGELVVGAAVPARRLIARKALRCSAFGVAAEQAAVAAISRSRPMTGVR